MGFLDVLILSFISFALVLFIFVLMFKLISTDDKAIKKAYIKVYSRYIGACIVLFILYFAIWGLLIYIDK